MAACRWKKNIKIYASIRLEAFLYAFLHKSDVVQKAVRWGLENGPDLIILHQGGPREAAINFEFLWRTR